METTVLYRMGHNPTPSNAQNNRMLRSQGNPPPSSNKRIPLANWHIRMGVKPNSIQNMAPRNQIECQICNLLPKSMYTSRIFELFPVHVLN